MKLSRRLTVLASFLTLALVVSTAINVLALALSLGDLRKPVFLQDTEPSDSSSDIRNAKLKQAAGREHIVRVLENEGGRSPERNPDDPELVKTGNNVFDALLDQDDDGDVSKLSDSDILQMILTDERFREEQTMDLIIRLGNVLDAHRKRRHKPETLGSNVTPAPGNAYIDPTTNRTVKLHPKALIYLTKVIEDKRITHSKRSRKGEKGHVLKVHSGLSLKPWQQWHNHINQFALYSPDDPAIDRLVSDLATLKIVGLRTMEDYGTQIKMVFKLSDGSEALFKPMRMQRDQTVLPDHFYFDEFERHTAEVAAFHLDRVMGFHRVPPVAGRFVNITNEIKRYAPRELRRTIYRSPAGNICFYGKCDYYCDSGHPVCGRPDTVEGSMAAWLPTGKGTGKKSWENPWGRSYSKFEEAEWEYKSGYCKLVRKRKPYDSGRRLLDVMDIAVFDFLTGNQDRHHYHTFKTFVNFTAPLLYDNGRGFGRLFDDLDILKPVTQCCMIRYTTLSRLLSLAKGPQRLSDLMRESLANDKLSQGPNGPVLTEAHLEALDRRVIVILNAVYDCTTRYGLSQVILDDGF